MPAGTSPAGRVRVPKGESVMTRAERFEKCFQDWLAAEAAGLKYDFEAERKRERIA